MHTKFAAPDCSFVSFGMSFVLRRKRKKESDFTFFRSGDRQILQFLMWRQTDLTVLRAEIDSFYGVFRIFIIFLPFFGLRQTDLTFSIPTVFPFLD